MGRSIDTEIIYLWFDFELNLCSIKYNDCSTIMVLLLNDTSISTPFIGRANK